MIQLVLVRHAKSDWSDGTLADHDRPLNARGRENAPRMAQRVANSGLHVDRILSSTAVRARRTAEAFHAALGADLHLVSDLYASSAETLWRTAADAGHRSTMLVAHDPGISLLAVQLSRGEIPHMPTCAVATFTWNTDDWADAAKTPPASWKFETPREDIGRADRI